MTDREKLIELLGQYARCDEFGVESCDTCRYRHEANCNVQLIADHLLANGVTFATDTKVSDKWIRVDDRLPENDAKVLVCDTREDYVFSWEYFGDGLWFGDEVIWATEDITHWMPLPEPPKEE